MIATVDMTLIRNAWQVRTMVEREAVIQFARTASAGPIAQQIAAHEAILERALRPQPDEALDSQAVDWGLHDLDADSMRPVQVVPAMREHLEFLQALAAGDREGALGFMMAHIEKSKRRVLAGMFRTDESPGA